MSPTVLEGYVYFHAWAGGGLGCPCYTFSIKPSEDNPPANSRRYNIKISTSDLELSVGRPIPTTEDGHDLDEVNQFYAHRRVRVKVIDLRRNLDASIQNSYSATTKRLLVIDGSGTLEGAVVSLEGGMRWRGITVESGGKRYLVTTSNDPFAKVKDPVVSGDVEVVGARVRVTYTRTSRWIGDSVALHAVYVVQLRDRSYKSPEPVERGVLNNHAIDLPKPDYPEEARKLGLTGTVIIDVVVDETGSVVNSIINQEAKRPEDYILWKVAIRAARQAKFPPHKVNGVPVKVKGQLVYVF